MSVGWMPIVVTIIMIVFNSKIVVVVVIESMMMKMKWMIAFREETNKLVETARPFFELTNSRKTEIPSDEDCVVGKFCEFSSNIPSRDAREESNEFVSNGIIITTVVVVDAAFGVVDVVRISLLFTVMKILYLLNQSSLLICQDFHLTSVKIQTFDHITRNANLTFWENLFELSEGFSA